MARAGRTHHHWWCMHVANVQVDAIMGQRVLSSEKQRSAMRVANGPVWRDMMIHTPVCDLLGITHPIVLGGMATGTSVPLVAAVSNTGGLGILGVTGQSAAEIQEQIAAIRTATDRKSVV